MKNFLTSLKKSIFPFLILFIALGLSSTAAYYSIIGLSKLFAGVAFAVIIMASFLEASKLIIVSLLYQYWGILNKWLRTYLIIASMVLVLITSMGIYGMLSSGYQQTYAGLSVVENKIEFLEQKKNFYENDVTRFDQELKAISTNINNLSTAKSSQIQVRDTSSTSGFRTTISTTELRMAQKRIDTEEINRKSIQSKREVAADSLQKYQLQILDLSTQSSTSGELGPLKYLAGLTGIPMDRIINYLLLTIIFVFDPLALSLVIAANFAFDQVKPKTNLYGGDEDNFSEWDNLDEDDFPLPNPKLSKAGEEYELALAKEIEVIEPKIIKGDSEFISKIDDIESKITTTEIIKKQEKKINILQTQLAKVNLEINELDHAAIKIVDSIKHIDDYLKHHGPYYAPNTPNWDEVKLGFAEESDYIDKRKLPRSKPKNEDDIKIY